MEEKNKGIPKTKKKRGRPPGQKTHPIMAVDMDTFEFYGVFPSSSQAAKILMDNYNMASNINRCAKGELKSLKGYRFIHVDTSAGITAEIIRTATEKIKERSKERKPLAFSTKILKEFSPEDYGTIKRLYDKYS